MVERDQQRIELAGKLAVAMVECRPIGSLGPAGETADQIAEAAAYLADRVLRSCAVYECAMTPKR